MRKQQGMSVMRALALIAIIASVAFLALKITPTFKEYTAIRKTVYRIATQGSDQSASDVRRSFDEAAASENIRSIKGSDLEISKGGGKLVIAFSYRAETPLFSNLALYFDFDGTTAPPNEKDH